MLKRSDITMEKLISDAEEARKLALRIDQPSAATGATTLQAKLVGLLVERKEQGQPGDFAGLSTPEQVMDAIRTELGEGAALALQAILGKPAPLPAAPDEAQPAPIPTTQGSGTLN